MIDIRYKSSRRNEFLKIDFQEREIFSSLMKNSTEFFKIEEIDRNVMVWLVCESPSRVKSWLEYLASDYRRKSISIDADKLFGDIQQMIFSDTDCH